MAKNPKLLAVEYLVTPDNKQAQLQLHTKRADVVKARSDGKRRRIEGIAPAPRGSYQVVPIWRWFGRHPLRGDNCLKVKAVAINNSGRDRGKERICEPGVHSL